MTDANTEAWETEAWETWLRTRLLEFQSHIFKVIGTSTGAEDRRLRAEIEQLGERLERHVEREINSAVREVRQSVRGLVRKELVDGGLYKLERRRASVTKRGKRT
jgi:hypothetical protein